MQKTVVSAGIELFLVIKIFLGGLSLKNNEVIIILAFFFFSSFLFIIQGSMFLSNNITLHQICRLKLIIFSIAPFCNTYLAIFYNLFRKQIKLIYINRMKIYKSLLFIVLELTSVSLIAYILTDITSL